MSELRTIQPIGFHLRLSSEWLVSAVSANIGAYLPGEAKELLGQPVTSVLCDDAIHDVRNRMALLFGGEVIEHLFHVSLVSGGLPFNLSVYRDGNGFGIDAEPSDGQKSRDAIGIVEGMLARVGTGSDVESLCIDAARQMRAVTGFDHASLAGGGKLLGQSARGKPGQSMIAAIPSIEDDLAVVDCDAEPVPILTYGNDRPTTIRSTLRSPTGDELAALKAVGARAALVVPLLRDGRAWGHLACYHSTPRHIGAERRSVAGLFARIIGLKIEIAGLRSGG